MNRYILIRRLRGPALLLLIGVIALLHSTGLVHSFWRWFWPLLFILLGVLLLAERAALAAEGGFLGWPYSGAPNQDAVNPGSTTGVPPYPEQPTSIVPASSHDFGKDTDGGQS
ncbi:MAG TPA: DUF5668 domain-containing protein [Terracidiphilus sp.]|nr:DUF5668 domain-containing protein [Terracidiphilus sp.]